jgi:hypothetical protein
VFRVELPARDAPDAATTQLAAPQIAPKTPIAR